MTQAGEILADAPGRQAEGALREHQLDDAAFRTLARLVHGASGIVLSDAKRGLVVSRLSRRLRALDLPDFGAYCRFVETPAGAGERVKLISALTTNVTRFFREDHHFRTLAEDILPPLLDRARAGGRVRIWSAGCSSGEEPYSIAIRLADLCPNAVQYDIRILATDIDPAMIARARAARYEDILENGVLPDSAAKHFRPVGQNQHEITTDLRALVRFAELNLVGDWPMRGPFDVIFCRNVVIYFDAATQSRLWERFARLTDRGGHLFVGHSERLGQAAQALFTPAGVTQYRRSDVPVGCQDAKGGQTSWA